LRIGEASETRGHVPLSGTSLGIGEASETRGHVPLSGTSLRIGEASETRGHVPLSGTSLRIGEASETRGHVPLSGKKRNEAKKKYNALWTQKFGKCEINTESYLNNTIKYIRNNRVKHELPKSERIEEIKKRFLCTKDQGWLVTKPDQHQAE
ncbi:MAG: hypothetical protein U9N86_00445, partial [Bacteroidota bacterium]|nr:hypothetical protein [Bacteroidota bacterium]